jgi:hypothetical protein
MMWHRNRPRNWVLGVLPALLVFSPCLTLTSVSAGPLTYFAVADEPGNDSEADDAPRPQNPGSVQKHRDGDEPSEDGTDDGPSASPPDGPPAGCCFEPGEICVPFNSGRASLISSFFLPLAFTAATRAFKALLRATTVLLLRRR